MKKNVVPIGIEALGIYEGDVVRIFGEDFSDTYRYKNGKFLYINGEEPESSFTELELMELLAGGVDYEILAHGGNESLTATVARMEDTVSIIEGAVNAIIDNQIEEAKKDAKARERKEVEDKVVFWTSVVISGVLLFIVICKLLSLLF